MHSPSPCPLYYRVLWRSGWLCQFGGHYLASGTRRRCDYRANCRLDDRTGVSNGGQYAGADIVVSRSCTYRMVNARCRVAGDGPARCIYSGCHRRFIVANALIVLCGVTGLFARLMKIIPHSLASAMLAGILLRFWFAGI